MARRVGFGDDAPESGEAVRRRSDRRSRPKAPAPSMAAKPTPWGDAAPAQGRRPEPSVEKSGRLGLGPLVILGLLWLFVIGQLRAVFADPAAMNQVWRSLDRGDLPLAELAPAIGPLFIGLVATFVILGRARR